MSTKNTIRGGHGKAGTGFHVYFDWDDDYDSKKKMPKFIHLELDRCEFEVSHKDGISWVDVKIPTALARKIGLITGWRESYPQEKTMQTTLPQLPEVGKTYISQKDPTLSLYVEAVETIEQDEFGGAGFIVTCSTPDGRSDEGMPCCELFDDEWASFRFTQVAA